MLNKKGQLCERKCDSVEVAISLSLAKLLVE